MVGTEQKLKTLEKLARAFRKAGILWALGASALLYFEGLAEDFHDFDILVSEDQAEQVRAILNRLGSFCPSPRNPDYRTRHFMEFSVDGVEIDILAGFAIAEGGRVHDCALLPEQISRYVSLGAEQIPLHSLALWQQYYTWMHRPEKAARIEKRLTDGENCSH